MEKTAHEIQKERIAAIEAKAAALLDSVSVATLTSISEGGYPRTCLLTKYRNHGFAEVYFITSKRSERNGKAAHFEKCPKASVRYCFIIPAKRQEAKGTDSANTESTGG